MNPEKQFRADVELLVKSTAFAGKLFAAVYPPAALAAVGGDAIALMMERSTNRRLERLELFVRALQAERLADADPSKVPPDLFDEIVAMAIQDEDKDKVPFYAALVELQARQTPEAFVIRLLANVLRTLTVHELRGLCQFAATGQLPVELPSIIDVQTFQIRLQAAGLFRGGTFINASNITPMGRHLVKMIRAAGLA